MLIYKGRGIPWPFTKVKYEILAKVLELLGHDYIYVF